MSNYRLVPAEPIMRAMDALERFASDTLAGRNSAHELRELLAAAPIVQMEHNDRVPDWSEAPEGATHWGQDTDNHYAAWYREKDGEWEFWLYPDDCSWDYAGIVSDRILIPRPETEWIPSNGKRPELPADTLIDIKIADGYVSTGRIADFRIWTQDSDPYDITHYRIHRPAVQVEPTMQVEPVAWGAFYSGGKYNGQLHRHDFSEEQIDRYIAIVHGSNASLTLRKGRLYAKPVPVEQQPMPDASALVEALEYLMEKYPASRHLQDTCSATLAAYRKGGE